MKKNKKIGVGQNVFVLDNWNKQTSYKNMEKKNRFGSIDLLRGRCQWGEKDSPRYRLCVIIIIALFLIGVGLVLKQWLLSAIATGKILESKILDIVKICKGRSP